MVYYDVIAFIPLYIFIEYSTKNIAYSRIFFNVLVSSYSTYEIIDKQYYTLEALNNFEEVNIVSEKCLLICLLYFIYDFFHKDTYNNITISIHHFIAIYGCINLLYCRVYGIITLYLCCHEISTIFLNFRYLNIYKNLCNKLFILTFLSIRCTTLPIITFKLYSKNNTFFIILLIDCGLHIFWISEKINNSIKKNKKKIKKKY